MQFKKRGRIFIALMVVNTCSALSFLCLGHPASAAIDLFGNAEIAFNSIFERRGQKVPGWLVLIYIIITVISGRIAAVSPADWIVVVAAGIFCLTILEKDEQKIRSLWMIVLILYIIYDVIVGAYVFAVSSTLSAISTLVAIIRYRAL